MICIKYYIITLYITFYETSCATSNWIFIRGELKTYIWSEHFILLNVVTICVTELSYIVGVASDGLLFRGRIVKQSDKKKSTEMEMEPCYCALKRYGDIGSWEQFPYDLFKKNNEYISIEQINGLVHECSNCSLTLSYCRWIAAYCTDIDASNLISPFTGYSTWCHTRLLPNDLLYNVFLYINAQYLGHFDIFGDILSNSQRLLQYILRNMHNHIAWYACIHAI